MTTIGAATEADLAAVGAIWNEVIRDTPLTFNAVEKTDDDLSSLLASHAANDTGFLVARDGDTVLGFGVYSQFRGGIGYARSMEHSIYLAPEAQGRGLGRDLLSALEDHARARGVHAMMAGISGENMGSVTFHEKVGYTRLARIPEVGFKFGRYLDLILLQKILT